jgi:hypothetical protein
MKKHSIVFLVVAALVFQLAVTGQVYARSGCKVKINLSAVCPENFKPATCAELDYYPADCEFWFRLTAIGLERSQSYTLLIGDDLQNLTCLGEGCTNKYGQVYFQGSINIGDLCDVPVGLVPSCDVVCVDGHASLVNPQWYRYFIGDCGITYDDTCDTLNLVTKDPDTWDIIPDGACGKLEFDPSACEFNFKFYGCGLEPGQCYTLIYYPDPWPGAGLICLGSGVANPYGGIKIYGSVDTGDLPAPGDLNGPDGAKIWLVLSDDVDCGTPSMMSGWNPTQYLFEETLITYTETYP